MKLLFDANISKNLALKLKPIFGECIHVNDIGLGNSPKDMDIWKYALDNEYIIVTKDSDFVIFSEYYGYPPKVLLIKNGNKSNTTLLKTLLDSKNVILEFTKSNYGILKILQE